MMIETILIIGVCYCVGVAVYLQVQYCKVKVTPHTKMRHGVVTEDDIVKKRHYTPRQTLPQGAIAPKRESIEGNETTFVSESEKVEATKTENKDPRSSQIPKERLDKVFSESPEKEIVVDDVSLEYEDKQEIIDLGYEDIPLDGESQESASGVDYNSLDSAINVTSEPLADDTQKDEAGKTFLQIENSNIYDQLIDDNPERKQVIDSLIDRHLNEYYKKSAKKTKSELGTMPNDYADFKISDFV